MDTLICDLEADNLLDDVTRIWQVSAQWEEETKVQSFNRKTLDKGFDLIAQADRVVGHNFIMYDKPVLKKVADFDLDWKKIADTLVLSRLGNPTRRSHALAAWGERFGVEKPIHEDWSMWSPAMEYRCGEDIKITSKLWALLKAMYDVMPDAVATEHMVAWLCSQIIAKGVVLNEAHVRDLASKLLDEQEKIMEDISETFKPVLVPKEASPAKRVRSLSVVNSRHPLAGKLSPGVEYCPVVVQEFNPGSTQQVAERLIRKYGWKPTALTPTGQAEVSEEVLGELPYPEAKVFLSYLQNEKNLSFIQGEPKKNGQGGGWLHHLKPDGRIHAGLNPLKAVTSRPSCVAPNLQNVPTDTRMRQSFEASDGRVLVGVDASGLELRCLGHYLAAFDEGAYAREVVNGDIHTRIMKVIGFDHFPDDPLKAKIGRGYTKNVEYSIVYGAGNARLGQYARKNARDQRFVLDMDGWSDAKRGKEIRAAIEADIPALPRLTKAVRARAAANRTATRQANLVGLDKRTLWVRSPHSALNLLLQSAGIIIIKKAMCLAEPLLREHDFILGRDYDTVLWVHDEWQIECERRIADEIGQLLTTTFQMAGEALGFKCELGGEYKIGNTWAETH